MSSSRHDQVGELFLKARDLAGNDRQAYLNQACASDVTLRAEVESLLAADIDDTIPLLRDTPISGTALGMDEAYLVDGRRIGQYTIQRVIGAGGMGTVFEALQERPRRRVALKVIRRGLVRPSVLRRFEYESQVLAMLRHPGIAQVYDAGVQDAPSGQVPYFAMEFIPDARPITEYVRSVGMEERQCLEIFIAVCDAVEHAHRNGVIHRDLKPDNVLVDKLGQPKVIDFGIARLMQSDGQLITLHTTVGEIVGTVPYLSPEQAAGDSKRIDTRTDVYALGIILYQVLTGQFPYSVEGGLSDILHRIVHVEPAALRMHTPRINDEVETIVLKCLHKDRDRRYQSAGELGRDIERYLKGEPIEAKRDSGWYMLRKAVRRYRVQAAVAASVVILILASAVALSQMYAQQKRERLRAERATVLAEQRTEEAERKTYIANLAAADHAISVNDAGQALKCLDRAPERLRHWEWTHLRSRADLSSFTLPMPERAIHVTFSPDGTNLAVSYWSGMVRTWNLSTRSFTVENKTLNNEIHAIAYSSDSTRIIAATGVAWCVFNASTGEELRRYDLDVACGEALAFNAVSSRIAFGVAEDCAHWYRQRGVAVYDAQTPELIQEIPTLDMALIQVAAAFSSNGQRLATGNVAGTLRVWDIGSGGLVLSLQEQLTRPYGITFSPDGRHLVTGHENGLIAVWDAATGRRIHSISGHSQRVWKVIFSPDGSLLASASQDKTIRIWNFADGSLETILRGHATGVRDVAFHADGKILATNAIDGTVKLWDAKRRSAVLTWETKETVSFMDFDAGWERVLIADQMWETQTGKLLWQSADTSGQYRASAVFSKDDSKIFAAGLDGSFGIVDTATWVKIGELRGHNNEVQSGAIRGHKNEVRTLAMSDDGRHLASWSLDGDIILWDAQSGRERHSLRGHAEPCPTLTFHPDGSTLASASADGTVKLWDVATGQCPLTYTQHTAGVNGVAFSTDGKRIASCSSDDTFRIWDPLTGETMLTVDGKMEDVWSIAFSPDGKRLVTGARDRTVRIWDAETGEELLILRGPTGTVTRVAWSPDGRRIVAGTWNRELFIWDSRPQTNSD